MTNSSFCSWSGMARLHSFKQPLPGVVPPPLHGVKLHAEGFRGFLIGQPKEELHFDDLAPLRLGFAQPVEEAVDGQSQVHLSAGRRKQVLDSLEGHEVRIGASARVVDQVPTHGSSSNSEKMLPILPIPVFGGYQATIDLADQFRGL